MRFNRSGRKSGPRISRPVRLVRHCEFEVQSRNLVSRMVIGVGELRYPIQQLRLLRWSLVDAGEEIDQMFTGFARSFEIDHHVALRIEAASVPHVRVIVGRGKDIVVFGPADALQVNGHWRSRRSSSRRHTHDTCFYREVNPPYGLPSVAKFERMLPTQIFRHNQRKFDSAIVGNFNFANGGLLRRVPVATHAATDVALPVNVQSRAGRKAFTGQLGMSTDRTLRGPEAQFGAGDLDFGFWERVRRIRLRISSGTRGPA